MSGVRPPGGPSGASFPLGGADEPSGNDNTSLRDVYKGLEQKLGDVFGTYEGAEVSMKEAALAARSITDAKPVAVPEKNNSANVNRARAGVEALRQNGIDTSGAVKHQNLRGSIGAKMISDSDSKEVE